MKTFYQIPSVVAFVEAVAEAAGSSKDDAKIFAAALVAADVNGTSTHGVTRLGIYTKRIQKGLIDPKAELKVTQTRPAVLSIDAGNGLGQVQAMKTLDLLIPLARQFGVASATISHSQHFGALSYFCNKAAEENMILLATTNCEPSMSPAGGYEAYFGTNPLGVSFPTDKDFSVKIDMATSIVARGNIIAAQKQGKDIPEGWALTAEGNPTTDAAEALKGTVLTMAGHKGYALALMVEVLSGVLSGAAVGSEIGSMYKHLDRPQNVGHFFCLLDVGAFLPVDEFKSRMGQTIDAIKATKKRPGVDEILIPGERSQRTADKHQETGIGIDEATLKEITQLAEELKVPVSLLKTA